MICDFSNVFLGIVIAPAIIPIAVFFFLVPELETLLKVGIVAALIIMEIFTIAVLKWRRPTLVLRDMKRQIEFFADTRCTSKTGELPVEQIAKLIVFQNTSPSGANAFSFKAVLKNEKKFAVDTIPFSFAQESEMNKTVQKLAGYAGVPAFDSKGNELPPLSYNL